MRFTVDATQFRDALSSLARIVPQTANADILACISIRAVKAFLHLSACDLHVQIETIVPAQVDEEGTVAFPGQLLAKTAKFADGDITVSEKVIGQHIMKVGQSTYKFSTLSADTFPLLPFHHGNETMTMAGAEAARLFSIHVYGEKDGRPYLGGVSIRSEEGRVRGWASNGLVGVRVDLDVPWPTSFSEVIVPSRSAGEIVRLFGQKKEVEVSQSKGLLRVHANGLTLTTKLIDAEMVDIEAMLPRLEVAKVTCDRNALERAVNSVLIHTVDRSRLRLAQHDQGLCLSAPRGSEQVAETLIPAEWSEDLPEPMHFSGKNFLDVCGFFATPNVTLTFSGARSTIVWASPDNGAAFGFTQAMS